MKINSDECCKLYYVEYDPILGIHDGWERLKKDGTKCPLHHCECRNFGQTEFTSDDVLYSCDKCKDIDT